MLLRLRGGSVQRIFVGDVQGCADELEALVGRATARFGEGFELWLVGDLVNRGPGSRRVVERVREARERGRARVVLGNHELALLRTYLGLRELTVWDSFQDLLEAPDVGDWVDWLRRLPLVETGQQGAQPFAMVHAASHPDWSLAELARQAARAEARLAAGDLDDLRAFLAGGTPELDVLSRLTRCRSVAPGGVWSDEEPAAGRVAWHEAWAARAHGYGLVYGHWSLQGLHVAPWIRGLDTGCVHHGRGRDGFLTAWLPDPDARRPFDVPDDRFWQERAHRAYYAHRDDDARPRGG